MAEVCKNCYRNLNTCMPEFGDVSTCHDCGQSMSEDDVKYIYDVHQKKLDAIGPQIEQEKAMSKWYAENDGNGPMLKEFEDYFQAYMNIKRAQEE